MTRPASLEDAVRAERAKYPALLTLDQPAKILNAVAWAHRADGWGLSAKPNGNHVPAPQGMFVAYDILHHQPSNALFGCFTDELRATVNWGEEIYHGDPVGRPWVAPIAPVDAPIDPPPPADDDDDPDAVTIDLPAIFFKLDQMEQRQQESADRTHAALLGIAESLDALRLAKQVPVTFPAYAGFLKFSGAVRLEPQK